MSTDISVKVTAPQWVHKTLEGYSHDAKQNIWSAFVHHMVGFEVPIHFQADLENYLSSIEESGELDDIIG